MVYRGKPSRACLECRIKRRKCDLSRPTCRQCARAGSRCDGYRNQNSLTIQDQTVDVLDKAQSSLGEGPPHIPLYGIHTAPVRSERPQRTLPLQCKEIFDHDPWSKIAISHEDKALYFFRNHYLTRGYGQVPGHPDCFSVVYARATGPGYLASLVTAVGLVSLSYLRNSPSLAHAAGQKYSGALRAIRATLSDPVQAASDEMLVAVTLLVLYETVACNFDSGLSPWDRHVDGALTLLQLRGVSQLRNRVGRSMFVNLRTEILVNCLHRRVRVPTTMVNCMMEARDLETAQEAPSSSLADIIVEACAVLASITDDTINKESPSRHISRLLSVDEDLKRWSQKISTAHGYTTTISNDTDDMYMGRFHTYTSVEMAHTWNLQRCARIILHQAIVQELLPHLNTLSSSSYSHLLYSSNALVQENSNEICCSAPYVLESCGKTGKSRNLRAARSMPLLWPLYVAGTAHTATDALRDWVLVQLQKIKEDTGIQQAGVMALHIQKRCLYPDAPTKPPTVS